MNEECIALLESGSVLPQSVLELTIIALAFLIGSKLYLPLGVTHGGYAQ